MRTWLDDVRDEAREEAREEIKVEVKTEIAKACLENGVDIDIVVKSTGFSREEVEKLARSIH